MCAPGSKHTVVADGLCDNGAHGEFLSEELAHSLRLTLVPVVSPCSVKLPDGSLLKVLHTATATVDID
eukprot:3464343-Rhodomonas_salina.1